MGRRRALLPPRTERSRGRGGRRGRPLGIPGPQSCANKPARLGTQRSGGGLSNPRSEAARPSWRACGRTRYAAGQPGGGGVGIRHAQGQGGPDVPGQGPPPGPRCRCFGQAAGRRQNNPPGPQGESPWWWWWCVCVCVQKHRRASQRGAEEVVSGSSLGSAPSRPERVCSESRGTYALCWGPKPF